MALLATRLKYSLYRELLLSFEKAMDNVQACESELWETTDSEDDVESESERLSNIDDAEVGPYLNNEKEMNYKKMIWELLNQTYIQEQEAKRVAGSAKVTNSKRANGHKKATVSKKAESIAKIAHPTSPKKRLISRINYNALSNVLDEPLPSNDSKKRRSESVSNKNVSKSSAGTQTNINADDVQDEFEDEENGWKDDQNYSHYSNQEEYDYYDDDDEFF